MSADTRVILAAADTTGEAAAGVFSLEPRRPHARSSTRRQPCFRKAPLFDHADMLTFGAADCAHCLPLDSEPDDVAALLPVRTLLTRDNQAVVVQLGASGAAAVWASRTMLVAPF